MKVLHIAPLNVAGVPYSMMEMQRRSGATARLVTLHRNRYNFPEDICLDLPLPRNSAAAFWRSIKNKKRKEESRELPSTPRGTPLLYEPANLLEALYFQWDDRRRKSLVDEAVKTYELDQYDIIHYDGGADLFRDAHLAQQWKAAGKKIVCHYMGSDLRLRGVHPRMEHLSDLNLTNESDHLLLHPNIHYLYIPFDTSVFKVRLKENNRLRIIHSPTNRAAKGTALILPVIEAIKKIRHIEFLLVENKTHQKVLQIKETCDIAIEQVGNYGGTGYGRNSLETLALGIPTITQMTPDYLAWLPENPFILANPNTLYETLLRVIDDKELRMKKKEEGRQWVERYHSVESVHASLMILYNQFGIV
ncbi:MAG: hypothetical protein V1799_07255 [bacterium]